MIDDLVLVGGLRFHPTRPTIASPALKADWPRLRADMNAARMQVSVGIAPQPLTGDVDAFNDFVFGKDSLTNDPGFATCAQALVDLMDREVPGWAGLSFDIEHITLKDPSTGTFPTPARKEAATLEARDRLTLFYQAVCIAASPRMVPIIAGAKIGPDHCFIHAVSGPFKAPIFAVLHDWSRIAALPNATLLAMAYDGDPGGGAAGRERWHRDTIKYATTTERIEGFPGDKPGDRPMIHPTRFQLLIKTGRSNKPGEPGMLETDGEIAKRMEIARQYSVGVCYFPGAPQNLARYEQLLNTDGGAPKPGTTNDQPYQHPIADVAKTFP